MPIHSTAIISHKAEIEPSTDIGPNVVIDEYVKVGARTKIWANAYITGHTEIGKDNEIHMGAVIGHEPQDFKFDRKCRSYLKIGHRNIFREYSTIHRGTEPESSTIIGDDNFFMGLSHVAHNCVIGNSVVVCNCALLAGHAQIGDRAFLSGGVLIHQFTRIGRLAMLSGNARVSMDVPPFCLAAERNEVHALNSVGLKRANVSLAARKEIKQLFSLIYRSGLNVSQAVQEATQNEKTRSQEAQEFIEFIRSSTIGICPSNNKQTNS